MCLCVCVCLFVCRKSWLVGGWWAGEGDRQPLALYLHRAAPAWFKGATQTSVLPSPGQPSPVQPPCQGGSVSLDTQLMLGPVPA